MKQVKVNWETDFQGHRVGTFGNHLFITTDADENGVSHIMYRDASAPPSDTEDYRIMTSIQGDEEFFSFVNECHSVWMSGMGFQ